MKKNNKLIAEFMGIETDENGMYRYTTSVDDYTTDDLSYFEYSWDWLMPVVEKIESLGYEFFIVEDRVNVSHNIYNSIQTIIDLTSSGSKINATYNAVIEFINEYNKNK